MRNLEAKIKLLWDKVKCASLWVYAHLALPLSLLLLLVTVLGALAQGLLQGPIFPLWGLSKKTKKSANSVDVDRVDEEGSPIRIGDPDSTGATQAPVLELDKSPKDHGVRIDPPGPEGPIDINLPDGVEESTVEQALIIRPVMTDTTVEDRLNVSQETLQDILNRYGKNN